jgi:hypothetical protein
MDGCTAPRASRFHRDNYASESLGRNNQKALLARAARFRASPRGHVKLTRPPDLWQTDCLHGMVFALHSAPAAVRPAGNSRADVFSAISIQPVRK